MATKGTNLSTYNKDFVPNGAERIRLCLTMG